jgi:succinyldiaminopimelate transaminase
MIGTGMSDETSAGFVPPPYPYERLAPFQTQAAAVPGGIVDLSIGTPCDPLPAVVRDALVAALDSGIGYPPSVGTPALREAAAGWLERRGGLNVSPDDVIACVGTKEFVASLPHWLRLRDPSRDTVLYPSVAYPSYEMGAIFAGCRAVPVALDEDWHLDVSSVSGLDASRALLLWVNEPGNPTGSSADREHLASVVEWARRHGIVVAGDECYLEFAYDEQGGRPQPASVLHGGFDGVLAVHSLSKRSNMAGMRVGFVAGDGDLVHYLGEVRKHAGFLVPGPVQAAAAAALCDDEHVEVQRARYWDRRVLVTKTLAEAGIVSEGGPSTFYLWCRAVDDAGRTDAGVDGWGITARLAAAGTLVSPGELYGEAGSPYVRLALVQPNDRLELAMQRIADTAEER